jgi:hypothetical protein
VGRGQARGHERDGRASERVNDKKMLAGYNGRVLECSLFNTHKSMVVA